MDRSSSLSQTTGYAGEDKDFHWLKVNIPCQAACPAQTDIPEYLAAIARKDYKQAYRINLEDNVFPAILGRVCARPCEPPCRHGWEGLGEPVAICFSKRSAADFMAQTDPVLLPSWFESTGKSVAVVGSGVAGLAAARQLACCGHGVTVFEMHKTPGGMLNQGIPEFRLPRDLIEREILQVVLQGVEIVCDTRIGKDISLEKLVDDYDAVILAAGTFRYNIPPIRGTDLAGIEHGMKFLIEVNEFGRRAVGKRVVVIGGGFTAMDCSRTAMRLGAETTRVAYRRTQNEMLVTPGEVEELEHEDIPIEYLVGPKAYIAAEGATEVRKIRLVRNELGEPDDSGRRRPVEVAGSEFNLDTDAVLLATGQFPETNWIDGVYRSDLVADDQWLRSGKGHATAIESVFVAGDFAIGASDLITAIGHAKECARRVDAFLMGGDRLVDKVLIEDGRTDARNRSMDFIPLHPMPTLPVSQRKSLDAEVETGFDEQTSVNEAKRCYLCHYKYEIDMERCVYCNQCMEVKPVDGCIVRVTDYRVNDQGRVVGWELADDPESSTADYYIDQEQCIRCNDCLEVCPVDCISVQKVSLRTIPAARSPAAT